MANLLEVRTMTEKDKELKHLREENARLQEELARAKDMQHQLFRLVPADRIIDLFREYPEEITKEQR